MSNKMSATCVLRQVDRGRIPRVVYKAWFGGDFGALLVRAAPLRPAEYRVCGLRPTRCIFIVNRHIIIPARR